MQVEEKEEKHFPKQAVADPPPAPSRRGHFGIFLRESLAVLAAILVAFGLDAGWDARTERIETRDALEAVYDEFQTVREQLLHAIERNQTAVAMKDEFLALSVEDIGSVTEAHAFTLVSRLRANWTFDPSRGALDGLIASGRIDQIANHHLRTLIAGWPGVYADLAETTIARWRDDVTRHKAAVGLEAEQRRVRAALSRGEDNGARELLRRAKGDAFLGELAAAFAGELEAYLSELAPALALVDETLSLLEEDVS